MINTSRASERKEELKKMAAESFFSRYSCCVGAKNIDFMVRAKNFCALMKPEFTEYLLWASVRAAPGDVLQTLSQLVLAIGKGRLFNELLPPKFLGCFDCKKIALIPYAGIQNIFYQSDFNWKASPSNR